MKLRFNWPFFVLTLFVPLAGALLAIVLLYPLVDNPYTNQIASPSVTTIGAFALAFSMMLGIMAYVSMPYLVIVKNNTITFHRLRRRLRIDLKNIKKVEVQGRLQGHGTGHNISFITYDDDRIIIFGLSHGITLLLLDFMQAQGVRADFSSAKIGKDVIDKHMRRGY